MKLVILLSLAVCAVASDVTTFSAENYYGYDFNPPPHVVHETEPFTIGLAPKLKSWAERFPALKNLINSKVKTLPAKLQEVTKRGYTHFSESAAMQAIEGVDGFNFDAFASYLVNTLRIPANKRKAFLTSLGVIKFADGTDWRLIDAIFSQDNGLQCKYVCVLGYRNVKRDTYDFLVADFKSSFQLASNIVLIEERKSYLWGLVQRANIRVEQIPATLKLEHIELLKTFFSQAALSRFAKMLDIRVPAYADTFVDPISVITIINAGLDIFARIINIFKTTSTSTIIKEIAGKGFSHYVQRSLTHVVQGIAEKDVMSKYVPAVPGLLKLTQNVFKGVRSAIEIGMFSEKNTWNDFKVAFNQDLSSTNTVRFVDVITHKRRDDKFNLLLVHVAQEFRLAPNIQYIRNSKSYVGGIYSKTTIERKEIPRSITDKDLEVLVGFFHVTVFKRLGIQYNLRIPPIPEKPLQ